MPRTKSDVAPRARMRTLVVFQTLASIAYSTCAGAMCILLWQSCLVNDFAFYCSGPVRILAAARCVHDELQLPNSGRLRDSDDGFDSLRSDTSPNDGGERRSERHHRSVADEITRAGSGAGVKATENHWIRSGQQLPMPVSKARPPRLADDDTIKDQFYQPIRLKIWYDNAHNVFSRNHPIEYERLQTGISRAVEQIASILSVIPEHEPLRFHRENICSKWRTATSTNHKKCVRKNEQYQGETCIGEFQIPDEHLEEFSVYKSEQHNHKHVIFEAGPGISDADTVIYVRVNHTLQCSKQGIIAYASFCKLGRFKRPVAGYANFCPKHLSADDYDGEKFFLTVLHEFFHILGISRKLFDKFQRCWVEAGFADSSTEVGSGELLIIPQSERRLVCKTRKNVVTFEDNEHRLTTPAVLREARKHFGCKNYRGVPLETEFYLNNKVTSHWESRSMQSSLMTATIGMAHLSTLDRMTIAVFEDSGWYQVNMHKAEYLAWGKGQGCNFGTIQYCMTKRTAFFCQPTEIQNGCHFLGFDKGVCETNRYLDSCFVYKASRSGQCWKSWSNLDAAQNLRKGEIYSMYSRCFLSNLTKHTNKADGKSITSITLQGNGRTKRSAREEGRCFEHRCNDSRSLEVRVHHSAWHVCPPNTWLTIPGYEGVIKCPSADYLCDLKIKKPLWVEPRICARINITFPGLTKLLGSGTHLSTMKNVFMRKLATTVNVYGRAHGVETVGSIVLLKAQDSLLFALQCRSRDKLGNRTCSCTQLTTMLKETVKAGNMHITINHRKVTARIFDTRCPAKPCPPKNSTSSENHHANRAEQTSNVNKNVAKNVTKNKDTIKLDNLGRRPPPSTGSRESITPSQPSGVLGRPGMITATSVGVMCVCVFVTVAAILCYRSALPRAVGPASGSATDVTYQHRSENDARSNSGSCSATSCSSTVYNTVIGPMELVA